MRPLFPASQRYCPYPFLAHQGNWHGKHRDFDWILRPELNGPRVILSILPPGPSLAAPLDLSGLGRLGTRTQCMPKGRCCNGRGACQCQSEQEGAQSTYSKKQARYCYSARFHELSFESLSFIKAGEPRRNSSFLISGMKDYASPN